MSSQIYNPKLQNRLNDYCTEIGSQAKAAAAIGLSESTISQYRRSIYEKGNIGDVEKKLTEFFNITDAREQQPSNNSPLRIDESRYIPTSTSEHIYKTIRYCQLEKGIMMIYGDAGIGKTKAAAKYVWDNPTSTVYLSATPTTGTITRFIRSLARDLRVPESRDRLDMVDEIKAKLLGTNKVLIIDEAQHLTFNTLEEIRNWTTPNPITNQPGIGIVLIGNPVLHTRMVGRQEEKFAQQFNRSRPNHYSALSINRTDIELMFPALKQRRMDKEINFLHSISNSRWAIRSAVIIWNDAVNGEDISYSHLKSIAQRMGIGVI